MAPAAIALGAALFEKHFTLDRSNPGPDHSFAVEPDELVALVLHIRDVETALGDGIKRGPSEAEAAEMYAKARRSVVAATDISAGTVIEREMLAVKRPGHGIKPKFIDTLVGRRAAVDIEFDDVITWEML
jgi:N-acetylneuraminate synthase/N,N'-diacetyllegionaminate synthase